MWMVGSCVALRLPLYIPNKFCAMQIHQMYMRTTQKDYLVWGLTASRSHFVLLSGGAVYRGPRLYGWQGG